MPIVNLIFRLLPFAERIITAAIEQKRRADIAKLQTKIVKLEDEIRIKKAASQAALEARQRREDAKKKSDD
jgi:hypothetical protein